MSDEGPPAVVENGPLEVQRRADGAATIWLSRPDVHNAFDAALIAELTNAVDELSKDDGVRAILLAGRGKSFSAGADLGWMKAAAEWDQAENAADAGRLAAMLRAFAEAPKPVIARVHGAAFGGGVGLAAVADICFAGPRALFCLSEVRLGLAPATISPHVVAAMGARAARRYWLTAETFDGVEAARIGLAHEAFTDDAEMDARIDGVVAQLGANAPEAMAATKALIRDVSRHPNDAALDADTATLIARLRTGAEGQEGLAAFFEKRRPDWAL